jgi:hypothetical protein
VLEARDGHVCVAFVDGSVLVAGGDTGKHGATNSAEVFHPDTHSWTATGAAAQRDQSFVIIPVPVVDRPSYRKTQARGLDARF